MLGYTANSLINRTTKTMKQIIDLTKMTPN
jgi:hypothetical protein